MRQCDLPFMLRAPRLEGEVLFSITDDRTEVGIHYHCRRDENFSQGAGPLHELRKESACSQKSAELALFAKYAAFKRSQTASDSIL